ncbi:MAG TPA: AEC family transporter [Alphaproteobacteria bacterium]|nr:AEC family transporter [Alphaproteobacteria bacterium]
MQFIVSTTLPLFGLILAGYVAGWRGWLGADATRALGAFVFYFSLPLLLFRTLATAPGTENFDFRFVLAYAAAALGTFGLMALVGRRLFGLGLGEGALFGMASCYGPTALVPLPIALQIFGPAAVLPLAMIIMIDNALLIPAAIAAQELERARRGAAPGRGAAPSRVWTATTRAVVSNPVIVATVLGIAFAFGEIPLPALVGGFAAIAGAAAIPCALFALGITLAGVELSSRPGETGVMVAFKLILYPALVFGLMALIPGLDPIWRGAALIAAAGPIGINVYLVAVNYQTYLGRASTAMLVATVLSLPILSAIAVWLAAAN